MPAKRLPWVKLWVESLEHEKIAALTDQQFRTWVMLLLRSSHQQKRGRFASVAHAVGVVARPIAHVKGLVASHLLDEREDGLWIHDFEHWQNWFPSDYQPRPSKLEYSAITPRSVREDSAQDRERDQEKELEAVTVERAPSGSEVSSSTELFDDEAPKEASSLERSTLAVLRDVPGYHFDYAASLVYLRKLAVDFPRVDMLSAVKKWADSKIDRPLTSKSLAHAQLRTWFEHEKPKPPTPSPRRTGVVL